PGQRVAASVCWTDSTYSSDVSRLLAGRLPVPSCPPLLGVGLVSMSVRFQAGFKNATQRSRIEFRPLQCFFRIELAISSGPKVLCFCGLMHTVFKDWPRAHDLFHVLNPRLKSHFIQTIPYQVWFVR